MLSFPNAHVFIFSRFNTFMLESQRAIQSGDKDALNIVSVDAKRGLTNLRYLLSADTRDERLNWCTGVVNKSIFICYKLSSDG